MSAVDFEGWASPPLVLTLGGHTYSVQPPSVEDSRYLIAAAARGEVVLGLVDKPLQPEVAAVLENMPKGHHPALGPVWDEMAKNGLPLQTMDRMAYYATFFWARGKEYADNLATLMWAPRDFVGGGESSGPKGPRRSRSGRSTA